MHRRTQNGGIVSSSNDALELATRHFCVLVDHDHLLETNALELIRQELETHADIDCLYTDEYHLLPDGTTHELRKLIWSPERFRSQMYTCHISVKRTSLMPEVGKFRDGFNGAQDYDLVLRITEKALQIAHIPVSLDY